MQKVLQFEMRCVADTWVHKGLYLIHKERQIAESRRSDRKMTDILICDHNKNIKALELYLGI